MWFRVIAAVMFALVSVTEPYVYHLAFLKINPIPTDKVGRLLVSGAPPERNTVVSRITHQSQACELTDLPTITSEVTYYEFNYSCQGLLPNVTGLQSNGIKVETTSTSMDSVKLTMIQFGADGTTQEGYLALPDELLGTEYYVTTYCSLGGKCQFAVTATQDSTSVFVKFPSSATSSNVCINDSPQTNNASSDEAVPFTLNEFDVLYVESDRDLSGTYIQASATVSVFAGSYGLPPASYHMIEQLLPVNKWGKDFYVLPFYDNDVGDIIKIITKTDNTFIDISGYSMFNMPEKGKTVERRIDWGMYSLVRASNPVMIMQMISVDLYNDTSSVTGSPAMVLVQSKEQWISNSFINCQPVSDNHVVVASVFPGSFVMSGELEQTTIDDSDVQASYGSFTAPANITGGKHGGYQYCGKMAASLVGIDLTSSSDDCAGTVSYPGDDKDNDCDGKIDEDTCTQADLETYFSSEQSDTGTISSKYISVIGTFAMTFKVSTCGIALVTLITADGTDGTYPLAQMSPSGMKVEYKEYSDVKPNTQPGPCLTDAYYWIQWEDTTQRKLKLGEGTDIGGGTSVEVDIDSVLYTDIIISSFTNTANFTIGFADKDCAKIIAGDVADNFGFKFDVPVEDAATFNIFLTSKVATPVSVDGATASVPDLTAMDTRVLNDSVVNPQSGIVHIEAVEEISVYVFHTTGDKHTGFHVLPIDILGPSFLLVNDSMTSVVTCQQYSADDGKRSVTIENILDETHMPAPVFCGTMADTIVQMPPKETLGTHFWIPAINFVDIDSSMAAMIHVVTSEDSTFLQILGDYHNEDIINLRDTQFDREFVSNEAFEIKSNKPVQVHLELRSSTPIKWASMVVIPPTSQYKNSTQYFPAFPSAEFKFSAGIDKDGTSVMHPSIPKSPTEEVQELTSTTAKAFFSMTFLKDLTSNAIFVVLSDVDYNDINEVCILTKQTAIGDNIDNDCDLLQDEEYCYTINTPGEIDYDIDGTLNEDCSVDGGSFSLVLADISIGVTPDMVNCSATLVTTTTAPATNAPGPTTPASGGSGSSSGGDETPTIPTTSEPTFSPVAPTITIGSTTPETTTSSPDSATPSTTNSTTTPAPAVETCVTDCLCPCGWVKPPQNYTPAQIESIVKEIQEKLKIDKLQLSSLKRSRTSAKDSRVAATAVGYVGLAFLVVTISAVVLLDVSSLTRDLHTLFDNIRQAYQN